MLSDDFDCRSLARQHGGISDNFESFTSLDKPEAGPRAMTVGLDPRTVLVLQTSSFVFRTT